MKNNIFTAILALVFTAIVGINISEAQMTINKIDPSIFPPAENGFKKLIIEVPYSNNDSNKKIDFYVGKWMEVDACNTFSLIGSYEEKDLQGWGYNYYVFQTKGDVRSTMMACPDATLRNLFVSAAPQTVNYNGRMPIVIYVPDGYEVQFKIFKAENETYTAAEAK